MSVRDPFYLLEVEAKKMYRSHITYKIVGLLDSTSYCKPILLLLVTRVINITLVITTMMTRNLKTYLVDT